MTEAHAPLKLGQPVPDFKLTTFDPTTGGFGEFSLEANKQAGKWTVLMFYPADFTFVCATEFAALAAIHADLQELGAAVCSVSTDTQFVHLAWQREEKELAKVDYPMGADPTGAVSRLFGVYDDGSGLALRGTFIISPDGNLMNSEVNFYNLGRNMGELLRKMKANVYLSKQPAEVCPASWTNDGDKTLTPGPDTVGRVHEALNA